MINSVRNTVLSVLNKNNYGYISPNDFNLFAKQAQLDIFENYFYRYNYQILKENARESGIGYADIKKQYEEVIDSFSKIVSLTKTAGVFDLPADYYTVVRVIYTNAAGKMVEAEKVPLARAQQLLMSNLTQPIELFPAYIQSEDKLTIYPDTISTGVSCYYVRYPKDPKWTYTLVSGEPLFNQGAVDYQDFELPLTDEPTLVAKILQFAGMSIREIEALNFASQQEQTEIVIEK
jgi:hypothetical protein